MSGIVRALAFSSYLLIPALLSAGEAEQLFAEASEMYESGDYLSAAPILEQVVMLAPEESNYHHLLGKTYGRLAESASWMSAMSYARKCLHAFQQAVELDGKNISALNDLKRYYEEAPGFLGGSKNKARQLESRLKALESADPA